MGPSGGGRDELERRELEWVAVDGQRMDHRIVDGERLGFDHLEPQLLEWIELVSEQLVEELLEPPVMVGRQVDEELLEQQHVGTTVVVDGEMGIDA